MCSSDLHPPLSSHPPNILEELIKLRIGYARGIRKDLLVREKIAESSLATPLARASSWKSSVRGSTFKAVD